MDEEKEEGIAFQTVGQFCLWRGENISVYEGWTEKVEGEDSIEAGKGTSARTRII